MPEDMRITNELKIAVLMKHMKDNIFQLELMKYSICKTMGVGLERC